MDRKEIKKLIPRGYLKLIAAEIGVHPGSISRYLRSKTNNPQIEITLLEKIAQLSKRKQTIIDKIKKD